MHTQTLTTTEAMEQLNATRQQIYELIERGEIRAAKLHDRGRLHLSAADVERLRAKLEGLVGEAGGHATEPGSSERGVKSTRPVRPPTQVAA